VERFLKRRRKEETKHIENTQRLVTEEIEVLKPVLGSKELHKEGSYG
jgi:hypothetical protein